MTTINKLTGAIGRVTIDRTTASQSETGREYWTLNAYTATGKYIGPLVEFAATRDEARKAGVDMGLGECPFLGASECNLDGQVRGKDFAKKATGERE